MKYTFLLLIMFSVFQIFSCKNKSPVPQPQEEPASPVQLQETIHKNIHNFFNEKKQFGQVGKITMVSGWEGGQRYVVLSDAGLFMVYLDQNHKIAQLWQKNLAGEFIQIF